MDLLYQVVALSSHFDDTDKKLPTYSTDGLKENEVLAWSVEGNNTAKNVTLTRLNWNPYTEYTINEKDGKIN